MTKTPKLTKLGLPKCKRGTRRNRKMLHCEGASKKLILKSITTKKDQLKPSNMSYKYLIKAVVFTTYYHNEKNLTKMDRMNIQVIYDNNSTIAIECTEITRGVNKGKYKFNTTINYEKQLLPTTFTDLRALHYINPTTSLNKLQKELKRVNFEPITYETIMKSPQLFVRDKIDSEEGMHEFADSSASGEIQDILQQCIPPGQVILM